MDLKWRIGSVTITSITESETPTSPRFLFGGLDKAGVELDERGFVRVNERLETSAPNVWALGECAGSPMFTHISEDDFRIVRDNLAGGSRNTRDRFVPYCMFTDPPLAHVGLSEREAERQRPLAEGTAVSGRIRVDQGEQRHEEVDREVPLAHPRVLAEITPQRGTRPAETRANGAFAMAAADPRLIVALDLPTAAEARAMVESLGEAVSFYKVGLELFAGDGMASVASFSMPPTSPSQASRRLSAAKLSPVRAIA